MKIKSIELKNFRRFEDEIIEFPDGLIGIVGKNGVGKSTLIEALVGVFMGLMSQEPNRRRSNEALQVLKMNVKFQLRLSLILI